MKNAIKISLTVLVLMLIGTLSLLVNAMTPQYFISEDQAKAIAQRTVQGEVSEVEIENDRYEVEITKDGNAQEVAISTQTGEVLGIEENDDEGPDVPITGSALERASAAALEYLGQGTVTDSEIGDEEGYYEIEVRMNNGREADVHLDQNFKVLSVEYD